jgi:uncharacterized protein YbjT (DUF2867 family)/ligand-binding SRPBCC domain-containing protein
MPGLNILVTGATGYIGSRLIPELLEAGQRVRCLSRNPEKLTVPGDAECVHGDVLKPETLLKAMGGIDAAYYLVHSMKKAPGDVRSFAEKDRLAAQNFAEAAAQSGVKRVIYLGGLGETGDHLSKHLTSRMEVGNILQSGQVPVTVFRAAIIVGAGGSSFEMVQALVEKLPVMICPRWVNTPSQPIALADVLHYLVQCLEVPETVGRTFDIGGPDVLTYREMMLRFAKVLGKKRSIIPVPVLTPKLSSYWVHLVTPTHARLARILIDGLKNPVVCKDKTIQTLIPHRCMDYETGIRRALDEAGTGEIQRSGQGFRLEWRQKVNASPENLMALFGDPKNLEPMTPPQLKFKIIPPTPEKIHAGAQLHYRLIIWGVPVHWITLIASWEPPFAFRDEQAKGPYRKWIHTHRFEQNNGGILVHDLVEYEIPLGWLGQLAHPVFVAWPLYRIFKFRSSQLSRLLRSSSGTKP